MRDNRSFQRVVYLCEGEACSKAGSLAVVQSLRAELGRREMDQVHTVRTRCSGFCGRAPVVCVQPDQVWYGGMDAEKARRVVADHLAHGHEIRDWTFHRDP